MFALSCKRSIALGFQAASQDLSVSPAILEPNHQTLYSRAFKNNGLYLGHVKSLYDKDVAADDDDDESCPTACALHFGRKQTDTL